MTLAAKVEQVAAQLHDIEHLGIAYSGGVDSATLLALAVETLGRDRVTALLAVSPSLASSERSLAHQVADQLGATVVELVTRELENPDYAKNGVDRCYFCKDELFTVIDDQIVASYGLTAVAYGENADDAVRPDRPGSMAATHHRVLRPLATAAMTKAEVRELARERGLLVADKAPTPCLSSRIPHGQPVTAEKLRQIDRGEDLLRQLGFTDCRLRHHGDLARIEVPPEQFSLLADHRTRTALVGDLTKLGFRHITLDLAGINSGAFTMQLLNLSPPQS